MIIAGFQIEDKRDRARFFQKSFLLANTSKEVVLKMLFLTFSNANIQFTKKELTWRSYTVAEALPNTKWVEFIDKKEFAKALDKESKTFVEHVAALEALPKSAKMTVYLSQAAQIAALKQDKAPTKVLSKYANYADLFLIDLAIKLSENIGINKYVIKLEEGKQPLYGPIYSSGPVKLEILKIYIETNLKTRFIQPFKSFAGTHILFDKKPDGNLCFCIDYLGINNLTIKNWYSLPLIRKALDWLDRAKQFIQLDLTNAYHQIQIKEGNKWKTAFKT